MNTKKHLPNLDYDKVREAEFIISTLHSKRRQRILDLLDIFGPMSANHISQEIKLDQSITDGHLRRLTKSGVVDAERRDSGIHFKPNTSRLEQITSAVRRFLR